ncbi:MAG TPA: hypothetical protein VL979_07815 [Solirubrobacteraceae bacterium]|nr:hypothetical protein [Solirubrobacteraceae bacterium]
MGCKSRGVAVLAALLGAIVAASAMAASAAAITEPVSFTNWAVWGSLTPKKLNEPVELPQGSTFNGVAEVTSTATSLSGTISGSIYVPPFKAKLKLGGALPTEVGVTFTQVGPSEGTISTVSPSDCAEPRFGTTCMNMSVESKADLGITATGLLGLEVRSECETSEPVVFHLSTDMPGEQLVLKLAGPHFTGTVTIPSITCKGLSGVAEGLLLTGLMSGPENPYSLKIGPNEPAAPTVTSEEATSVSQVSADLHASEDTNGEAESDCHFEYGTTAEYGTSVPCSWRLGSGFAVNAPLTELSEGQTYHYRIVATNTLGTSYGADQTFTTLSGSPEYGRCVAQKGGEYSDPTCQNVAEKKGVPDHKGKYEWLPGPTPACVAHKKGEYTDSSCSARSSKPHKGGYEKAGAGFTASTGAVTLETAQLPGAPVVTCSASSASGEVTGTATGSERITFTGCESSGRQCTSEGPDGTPSPGAGTIVTNLLATRLLGPVAGSVWTELASSEHQPYLAEFGCGGILFRMSGSLGGVQSGDVDAPSLTSTTSFSVEEGREAEQAVFTEASEDGGSSWTGPDASTLVMRSSNTAASAVEIRP